MESGNPESSLPNSKISSCLNLKSFKYNPFFLLKEIILFVVSVNDKDPFVSYRNLQKELLKYDKRCHSVLGQKKSILVLTGQEVSQKKIKSFQDHRINFISFFDNCCFSRQKNTLISEMTVLASS